MANYAVSPSLLQRYLPAHTEPDVWNGTSYVSLVGFMFVNVRMKGFKIPFHVNFEEVNLRFYVRHFDGKEWKRGVVFLKEIVPRHAITLVANTLYGENYQTLPMRHSWTESEGKLDVEYAWKTSGKWNRFSVSAHTPPEDIPAGCETEFITEHFWGYTTLDKNVTSEYEVSHPRWQSYPVTDYSIDVDFGRVYGSDFAFLSQEKPVSVYLAEGSDICVHGGKKIRQSFI
jgi:hypothetical protein